MESLLAPGSLVTIDWRFVAKLGFVGGLRLVTELRLCDSVQSSLHDEDEQRLRLRRVQEPWAEPWTELWTEAWAEPRAEP